MTYRKMDHRTIYDRWRLGASPPNLLSSPPAPSSSGKKLFSAYGPIRGHLRCRQRPQSPRRIGLWPQGNSRVADLFLVAPLRRTFAQQIPRRCASGLLVSQVRRRR